MIVPYQVSGKTEYAVLMFYFVCVRCTGQYPFIEIIIITYKGFNHNIREYQRVTYHRTVHGRLCFGFDKKRKQKSRKCIPFSMFHTIKPKTK